MANIVDPDQTAPIGAVCSGSMLFASILNLSVMLGNYFHQTTSVDDIFKCIFFLGALRVKVFGESKLSSDLKKQNFQECYLSVKQYSMGPEQTQCFVRPDQCTNHFQQTKQTKL